MTTGAVAENEEVGKIIIGTRTWIPPQERTTLGLTFDDALVMPAPSGILPKDTNTRVRLCGDIYLNAPFISAPMDRVTEVRMCIAIGLFGGIGILHREMGRGATIQAVREVKRFMAGKIKDPVTVRPSQDLASVRKMRSPYTSFPVTEETGLVGILTKRDMKGKDGAMTVRQVMTSRDRLVVGHPDISLDDAFAMMRHRRVEKLPLVDDGNILLGLVTSRDLDLSKENPNATIDQEGRLRVGVAVGSKDQEGMVALVKDLIQVGVDLICIDSAHGGHIQIVEATRRLKQEFPELPVIAGNVADKASARELLRAGADALRCGIGAGSICTTRVVTGCGVPQLTAVMECRQAVEELQLDISVISDGGATEPGHSTKGLAYGASAMMFGNLLAGTDEAPGDKIDTPHGQVKSYRGMGSAAAMKEHGAERYFKDGEGAKLLPEGVDGNVKYKGPVREQLEELLAGLKSGMGLAGAPTIPDLWRCRIVQVTPAGQRENRPHNLMSHEG